jgi:hypothetical protein
MRRLCTVVAVSFEIQCHDPGVLILAVEVSKIGVNPLTSAD